MSNTSKFSTLCQPDNEKSCFACCPPIRPEGYDHADYQKSLIKQLRKNTTSFQDKGPRQKTITGFHCWGLGFLDRKGSLIGCLLHPAQNQGCDLRDLTGYGDKCRRELCQEAKVFSRLTPGSAEFVLGLTRGLDSFAYSSSKRNPAFRLLRWGPKVIERLALSGSHGLSYDEYHKRYGFLDHDLDPRRDAFSIELLLDRVNLDLLGQHNFLTEYKETLSHFRARHRQIATLPLDNRPFLHQLDLPSSFISFLRYGLDWTRALPSEAETVRQEFEDLIAELTA